MNLVIPILALLGILSLLLFVLFREKLVSYLKLLLAFGGLLLLSVAVALYLKGSAYSTSPAATEHNASPQATRPSTQQMPISPISPISAIVDLGPAMVEVDSSEIKFSGCLAFTSNRAGNFEILVLTGSDGGLDQLTNDLGLDMNPAWSPNGEKIAFASNRETGTGLQLYVTEVRMPHPVRLGVVQPGDNAHPSWSPDGKTIVFQSKRDVNFNPRDDNLDIYVMNSDGSDIEPLTTHSADDSEPVWSPDGERIAFISERDGQDEIYLMNSDGTNQTRFTDLAVLKSGLSWSRDGRFILFEGDSDLYILDVETQETTNLTQTEDVNETTPEWVSEDIIAFSSDRAGNWDLYLADISNPSEVRLTRLTDEPGIDHSPAWFPCITN